jgi:hypothetical protein
MESSNPKNVPEELKFPKNLNFKTWSNYLERSLTYNEKIMMESYRAEKYMNELMNQLYKQCNKNYRLYVPVLTELDGNCLFESLVYHGIGKDSDDLRTIISMIMYIYKDYKGFLPTSDTTLKDIFNLTNEVEYVSCKKKINDTYSVKFYKYEYNTMCQDLSNKHSWSRLPTHLILMIISYLFKVDICVINNKSDYENRINAFDAVENKPELKTIYLGHLGESHYVPLDLLKDEEEFKPIYYNNSKIRLIMWAKKMEEMKIENYFKQESDNKNSNENFKEIELDKLDSDKSTPTVFF